MREHHLAWLSAHLERSAEWLADRLRDGFDIHHIDGDHGNNDPKNLVLIECGDHLMLHNGSTRLSRIRPSGRKRSAPVPGSYQTYRRGRARIVVAADGAELRVLPGERAKIVLREYAERGLLPYRVV